MKDESIYNLWTEFINDTRYKEYMQLPSMLEIFNINLNKLKTYIDINKQKPSRHSNDKNIKRLGIFIGNCQIKYVKNKQNDTIYKLYNDFINDEKYKKYFQLETMLEKFIVNLNKVKTYITPTEKKNEK